MDPSQYIRSSGDLILGAASPETGGLLREMASVVAARLQAGGKLLLCGNGGSAADAEHFAAEFLVRLRPEVNREGIPAVALTLGSSTLTAHANDYGFESVFERMVSTVGQPGDVLLGISTSGDSPNVVRALEAARRMGIVTLGFLGSGGGAALAACDHAFVVPSDETGMIQTVHSAAGHALLLSVEDELLTAEHVTVEAPGGSERDRAGS